MYVPITELCCPRGTDDTDKVVEGATWGESKGVTPVITTIISGEKKNQSMGGHDTGDKSPRANTK